MKDLVWIYAMRQKLKRAAPNLDPYVGSERYFEYSVLLRSLRNLSSHASILDVGSGNSLLPTLLAASGFIVTCVDPYEMVHRQRVFAQALGKNYSINVVLANGERLPFVDCSFDAVTCISTLEHIPDNGDTVTMCEVCRVLKPGGIMVMSFPWQKFYYEYWGKEPLYANDNARELKLLARSYDVDSLEDRLLKPSGLHLTYGIRGKALSGVSWVEFLLRHSPLPGLADAYRALKYSNHSLGEEILHHRYTGVLVCQKPTDRSIGG